MPIEVKPDEQYSNILWQIFPENWTWQEYLSSTEELTQRIAEQEQITHTLVNLLNTKVPKSGTAFQYGRRGAQLFPDNTGRVVVITNNMLIGSLVATIRKIIQAGVIKKVYTVASIEEGYEIIQQAEKHDSQT